MKIKNILLLGFVLVFLQACHSPSKMYVDGFEDDFGDSGFGDDGFGAVPPDALMAKGPVVAEASMAPSARSAKVQELPVKSNSEAEGRKIIYNAQLVLVVDDFAATESAIHLQLKNVKGWLQSSRNSYFRMRVPAENLNQFIKALYELGVVKSKVFESNDVTEQFLDVELRLKNAEKALERLRELYNKAKAVKDILLIEKEITRLSTQIESFKGKLKFWKNQVAYSTVTLNLEKSRDAVATYYSPFYWLNDLAMNLNSSLQAREVSSFWSSIKVDWPEDFVVLSHSKQYASAMTAEGVFASVKTQKTSTPANLNFWSIQAKNVLEKAKFIRIGTDKEIKLENGKAVHIFKGKQGQKSYWLILSVEGLKVQMTEIWGPKEAMDTNAPQLDAFIKSL